MMPVQIRKAVQADIPELIRLGRAFYEASCMKKFCGFDEATLTQTLTFLLAKMEEGKNDAMLLVSDHIPYSLQAGQENPKRLGGMLALMAFPSYFDAKSRMVQELFWWAEDGHGIDLLNYAKLWARETNCRVMLVSETGGGDERMKAVYERMGFEPVEQFYMGDVSCATNLGNGN